MKNKFFKNEKNKTIRIINEMNKQPYIIVVVVVVIVVVVVRHSSSS